MSIGILPGMVSEIRQCSRTGGRALHAVVKVRKGQVISDFKPKEVLDQPNYLTVQISDDRHIMLDPEYLQYINHSCDPNVFFDTQRMQVIAVRDIEVGEEFSFFYPSTEWSMQQAFDCVCGSENCLGKIQGAAHLPLDTLANYQLSGYIENKISGSN